MYVGMTIDFGIECMANEELRILFRSIHQRPGMYLWESQASPKLAHSYPDFRVVWLVRMLNEPSLASFVSGSGSRRRGPEFCVPRRRITVSRPVPSSRISNARRGSSGFLRLVRTARRFSQVKCKTILVRTLIISRVVSLNHKMPSVQMTCTELSELSRARSRHAGRKDDHVLQTR